MAESAPEITPPATLDVHYNLYPDKAHLEPQFEYAATRYKETHDTDESDFTYEAKTTDFSTFICFSMKSVRSNEDPDVRHEAEMLQKDIEAIITETGDPAALDKTFMGHLVKNTVPID